MKTVGLTGGIGSGKSLVASIFEKLGYLVYHADERSKILLSSDAGIIQQVVEFFGEEVLDENGKPDRKKLAAIVFKKPKKLKALNQILHPAVGADFKKWMDEIEKNAGEGSSYPKKFILKEAAILFEAGTAAECDRVVEVFAPKEIRIRRVVKRDKVKAKDVIERMNRQWPETEKIRLSDIIIFNDGEHAVIPQVMAAAEQLEKDFAKESQEA